MEPNDESSPSVKRKKSRKDKDVGTDNAASSSQSNESQYAKSYLRVSKDILYMILALWMEDFVDETPKLHNKVGAVLVLPNDIVCGADCSRDGVHAVARLLMKHYDKASGSRMFMSRKPCPMCAKLLVQSKVTRVLFLPFEPEYYRSSEEMDQSNGESRKNTLRSAAQNHAATECQKKEVQNVSESEQREDPNKIQMKEVDNLFIASCIAQTRFVLKVEQQILEDAELKTPSKGNDPDQIKQEKTELIKKFGFEKSPKWIDYIKGDLPWPAFDDKVKEEFQRYFENAMEWIARAKVLQGRGLNYKFKRCNKKLKRRSGFNPEKDSEHAKKARHFITMARFLSERTDDPKVGVGAVIVSYPEMEILSFGWNGFPLKALYGEFARASKDDGSIQDKKYPYIIHAEQNALLMRNRKNIKDAILFVTKCPCDECTPLIAMEGIKTVVVDDKKDVSSRGAATEPNTLSYKIFTDLVKENEFVCFETVVEA